MKKKGWIALLVIGIAMLQPCSALLGPNDLWEFNSPIDFEPGEGIYVDYYDIWTTNSPLDFMPGYEVDHGILLKDGIDEGFTINPDFAAKIGTY